MNTAGKDAGDRQRLNDSFRRDMFETVMETYYLISPISPWIVREEFQIVLYTEKSMLNAHEPSASSRRLSHVLSISPTLKNHFSLSSKAAAVTTNQQTLQA